MAACLLPVLALVTLGACSGDDKTTVEAGNDATTTTSTTATTTEPDAGDDTTTTSPVTRAPGTTTTQVATSAPLVLQIHTAGGFVPVDSFFASLPEFTLYADGRVIVTGPTTLEFPGSALPNLQIGRVNESAVRDALDAAQAAGVADRPDLGQPPIADAPTTTFRLVRDGRSTTLDAYAVGMTQGPGLTAPQLEARRRLAALVERMAKLGASATEPFRATTVSVLVRPYTDPEGGAPPPEPAPGEAAWPLASLATGGKEQSGGRCLGFTGAEATRVLAAAANARSNTRWRSGDATWSLTFRPELPGTESCAIR